MFNTILYCVFVKLEDISSPWMVFEYMAYGDLTEVLRNSNEQFTNRSLNLPIVDKVSMPKRPWIWPLLSCIYIRLECSCSVRVLVPTNYEWVITGFPIRATIKTDNFKGFRAGNYNETFSEMKVKQFANCFQFVLCKRSG